MSPEGSATLTRAESRHLAWELNRVKFGGPAGRRAIDEIKNRRPLLPAGWVRPGSSGRRFSISSLVRALAGPPNSTLQTAGPFILILFSPWAVAGKVL